MAEHKSEITLRELSRLHRALARSTDQAECDALEVAIKVLEGDLQVTPKPTAH